MFDGPLTDEDVLEIRQLVETRRRRIAMEKRTSARETAFALLAVERQSQDDQWGGRQHDAAHTPAEWQAILTKHVGKLAASCLDDDVPGFHERLIKVAAVAVAALEASLTDRPDGEIER